MNYLISNPGAIIIAILAVGAVIWLASVLLPRRSNRITTVGPSDASGEGRRFSGLMIGVFLGIIIFMILLLMVWLVSGMPDTFLSSSTV